MASRCASISKLHARKATVAQRAVQRLFCASPQEGNDRRCEGQHVGRHIAASSNGLKMEFSARPRAVLGCILIPADIVIDQEFRTLLDRFPNVVYCPTRMSWDCEEYTDENYQRNRNSIGIASSALRPYDGFTVIGLACTSMGFALGPETVDRQLKQAHPSVKTCDMARSQCMAIKQLGARKVALLTPYVEETSLLNQRFLEAEGLQVVNRLTFGLELAEDMARVTTRCITQWAEVVDDSEAEVVVLGCGGIRVCSPGFIDDLEDKLKKPVVTSNQAFFWNMLRLADIKDQISGYGRLFREH